MSHRLRALERTCAANIDIKSFSDRFYRHYCHARLQPVLIPAKNKGDGLVAGGDHPGHPRRQ